MPNVSARADRMPSSPIRKLAEFAVAAEGRGTHVHYLNIGQPDVLTPDEFWDAVKNSHIKTLEYSHSAGIRSLREAMADHYVSRGIDIKPPEVMVTTGGSEAMQIAFMACFDPGDELIVVEPFYANYSAFASIAGVKLVTLSTYIDEDFALPGIEAIAAKVTDKTKGILICNPSNPTGTVYPPDTLRAVAEIAKQKDIFLIVDEVYRDFYYGAEDLLSVMQIPGIEEHAVMIDSASKKFSLCGARVGFFVSRNPKIMAAALKFGQARLASPSLDQIGVEACLRNTPASYFAEVRAEYITRRDLMRSALAKMPGVLCPTIDGAFYSIVRLPVDDTDKFCEWMVSNFAYKGQTVLLAPAAGFYATPGRGKDEVRIAYVLGLEPLAAAMEVLAHALEEYPHRRVLEPELAAASS